MTDESLSFIDMNPSGSDSDPIEAVIFSFRSYIFGPVNVVQERRNFNIREQVNCGKIIASKIYTLERFLVPSIFFWR